MVQKILDLAIKHALIGNWEEAKKLNLEILKQDPNNIDTLNRLAKAYAELGNLQLARKTVQKVIKNDPFNSIALKSLEKWKNKKKLNSVRGIKSARVFLEEPGKTKTINLIHCNSKGMLTMLDSGDEVKLNAFGHRMSVCTQNGKYIGRLPDDLSARLKNLMSSGNEYEAYVKSVTSEIIKIIIRETKRAEKIKNLPSFPSEKIEYVSFTPPELIHKKDEHEDDDELPEDVEI